MSGRDGSAIDLLDEPLLQGDGGSDRRAWRTEDGQDLVASELDHTPPVFLDHRACHLGEACGETCSPLVPVFLRERRPATHVGDQERVDVGVLAGARPG